MTRHGQHSGGLLEKAERDLMQSTAVAGGASAPPSLAPLPEKPKSGLKKWRSLLRITQFVDPASRQQIGPSLLRAPELRLVW